jgi:FixJ family two-component response regulator
VLKFDQISIIDDDESSRQGLKNLVSSMGYEAESFPGAADFLRSGQLNNTSCLILDVRMPGMSGLDLQSHLAVRGQHIPIIFVTAHADAKVRARALKAGATNFLTKPISHEDLLRCIRAALSS